MNRLELHKIYDDAQSDEIWRQATTGVPGGKQEAGMQAILAHINALEKDREALAQMLDQCLDHMRKNNLKVPLLHASFSVSGWAMERLTR